MGSSESYFKGTILLKNYWKMTILWAFSYNFIVKFHIKKILEPNTTLLYPNPCSNEVCYKGDCTIWASLRENLSLGFQTKPVSNQTPQLQKQARKLKFCM